MERSPGAPKRQSTIGGSESPRSRNRMRFSQLGPSNGAGVPSEGGAPPPSAGAEASPGGVKRLSTLGGSRKRLSTCGAGLGGEGGGTAASTVDSPGGSRRRSEASSLRRSRLSSVGGDDESFTLRRSMAPPAKDPLDDEVRRLLGVPAKQRDARLLNELVKLTTSLAGDYFSSLTEAQHRAFAKAWRYQWFPPGSDIAS